MITRLQSSIINVLTISIVLTNSDLQINIKIIIETMTMTITTKRFMIISRHQTMKRLIIISSRSQQEISSLSCINFVITIISNISFLFSRIVLISRSYNPFVNHRLLTSQTIKNVQLNHRSFNHRFRFSLSEINHTKTSCNRAF